MSLGNLKLKKLGNWYSIIGCLILIGGLCGIYQAYHQIMLTTNPEKVQPAFSEGIQIFLIMALLILVISLALHFILPKADKQMKYGMASPYKLFLMFLPFLALTFVFAYLPLLGWRYAFFDYRVGDTLSKENFVGFKWFTYLFRNPATVKDILRVLKNTLSMSGLGLAFSWVPIAFAIFLSEMRSTKIRRFVQTFTTVPNFISWVLVYAVALAIFSTDGFISSLMMKLGVWESGKNFLMSNQLTYLKMWLWGTWKGLGWGAIIYIAAISGIDQQLYEAATVDGAGRFQRMWHITVPGLIPTYCVLLLLSIASILSNGFDQYLVFDNASNTGSITVLDLYVYKLGIDKGLIPISTVIGMLKSIISVTLLFSANRISKWIRGESII
jgi:putative aldouronate transport system permease protein